MSKARTSQKQLWMLLGMFSDACKACGLKQNDTIRHEITVEVLKKLKSWKELNQGDVDKLIEHLALMKKRDIATMALHNSPDKERERLIIGIEKRMETFATEELDGEEYVRSLCLDRTSGLTDDWRNLRLSDLRGLHMVIDKRSISRRNRDAEALQADDTGEYATVSTEAATGENEPF